MPVKEEHTLEESAIIPDALAEAELPDTEEFRAARARALKPVSDLRFLVDQYYAIQDYRIQANNQKRVSQANASEGRLNLAVEELAADMRTVENRIRKVLDDYTDDEPTGMGAWAKSQMGIGPVIAAGLLAHIDITKAPTTGHIWRFAGLDPTSTWGKKEKRPWNAKLKVLCWKMGESFVKISGRPNGFYGHVYQERKAREIAKNEAGEFAPQAALVLSNKKFARDTGARKMYESGKLPAAHIHARAKRYAVKLFLAHFHDEWFRRHYGTEPPLPYPIARMPGHSHVVNAPDADYEKSTDGIWADAHARTP